MLARMILGLVLGATALAGQSVDVDFRNFTYPFEKDPGAGSTVRWRWMPNVQATITLVKGRYEFAENDLSGRSVHYT